MDSVTGEKWNDRTVALLGEEGADRLARSSVLIVGLGGVGGYAVEMLARSGIGSMTVVDSDCVAPSNLNRQIIATAETIGRSKSLLFAERIRSINPSVRLNALNEFLCEDNIDRILAMDYDYIVDAIDTVAPKTMLLARCLAEGRKVISSMGAGGRIDPAKVGYADLWSTREDGLARAVRQRLKKAGLRRRLTVVCSCEAPRPSALVDAPGRNKLTSFGTTAIVPSVFGIYLASKVICDISGVRP